MKYKALSQALATAVAGDIVMDLVDMLPAGFAEGTTMQFITLVIVFAAWTFQTIGIFAALIIYTMGKIR